MWNEDKVVSNTKVCVAAAMQPVTTTTVVTSSYNSYLHVISSYNPYLWLISFKSVSR